MLTIDDEMKETISDVFQAVDLLSTRLRQNLEESTQQAVDREGAAFRAVRAMKRISECFSVPIGLSQQKGPPHPTEPSNVPEADRRSVIRHPRATKLFLNSLNER